MGTRCVSLPDVREIWSAHSLFARIWHEDLTRRSSPFGCCFPLLFLPTTSTATGRTVLFPVALVPIALSKKKVDLSPTWPNCILTFHSFIHSSNHALLGSSSES